MLQNFRVTAFTASKLLGVNQQGDGVKYAPPRLGIRVRLKNVCNLYQAT